MKRWVQIFIVLVMILQSGCYSFKGISMPAGIDNYYVPQVQLNALEAPADITNVFRETLRAKVRQQSSLKWNEETPDVEFNCTIINYRIDTEAASQGSTVTLNKLTITVSAEYVNNQDDEDTWKKNFSYGVPFDPNIDFSSNQDAFIDDIFDQITEQIFNEAFAQW